MVQSLESGAAEDLVMVANAYRAALNHDAGEANQVRAMPGALAAAHRLGITAPLFTFERVARAVRLAERVVRYVQAQRREAGE